MLQWVREHVAFLRLDPGLFARAAVHGLEELAEKLHAMTRQAKWRKKLAAEIPGDVVHLFAAVACYDQIVDVIETAG